MIRAELSMETNYLSDGFTKIDHDLRELMTCLNEVLEELGEEETRKRLPWLNGEENGSGGSRGLEQAYSIAFQLLNIVEANAAERTRRQREIHEGLVSGRGLWGDQLSRLQHRAVDRRPFGEDDGAAARGSTRLRTARRRTPACRGG
jgi:phosphoenolpyruvate carboxylase